MNDKPIIDRAVDWISSTPGQVVLAGLVGGILRWLTTEKGWKGGLASLLSGLASAWFFAPPLAVLVAPSLGTEPDSPRLIAGAAFFVGIGGISIVALVINIFKGLNTNNITSRIIDAIVHFFTSGRGPKP